MDLKYRWPARFVASWVGLIAVVLMAFALQPETFSRFSVVLITALAGCLIVASLGQNLVVMVGAIDMSVPSMMTLAAALNVHLVGQVGVVQSLLISVGACALISAINGALIAFLRLNALIVTFATNAIVIASLTVWLGLQFSPTGKSADWLRSIGTADWLNVSALFWLALAVAAITAFVLSRTRSGRRVAAVGANRAAARMLGARVGLIITVTFAVAGAFYAIAGLFVAGLVDSPNPGLGNPYQLTTITVVAIAGTAFAGGTSSIAAVVAAAFLLQTLNQFLALQNFGAGALNAVQGVLLVAAVSLATWAQMGRQGFQRLRSRFGSVRSTD